MLSEFPFFLSFFFLPPKKKISSPSLKVTTNCLGHSTHFLENLILQKCDLYVQCY